MLGRLNDTVRKQMECVSRARKNVEMGEPSRHRSRTRPNRSRVMPSNGFGQRLPKPRMVDWVTSIVPRRPDESTATLMPHQRRLGPSVAGAQRTVARLLLCIVRFIAAAGSRHLPGGTARYVGIRPSNIARRGFNTGRGRTSGYTVDQGIGEAGDLHRARRRLRA